MTRKIAEMAKNWKKAEHWTSRYWKYEDYVVDVNGHMKREGSNRILAPQFIPPKNDQPMLMVEVKGGSPFRGNIIAVSMAEICLSTWVELRPSSNHLPLFIDGDIHNTNKNNLQWLAKSEIAKWEKDNKRSVSKNSDN